MVLFIKNKYLTYQEENQIPKKIKAKRYNNNIFNKMYKIEKRKNFLK